MYNIITILSDILEHVLCIRIKLLYLSEVNTGYLLPVFYEDRTKTSICSSTCVDSDKTQLKQTNHVRRGVEMANLFGSTLPKLRLLTCDSRLV